MRAFGKRRNPGTVSVLLIVVIFLVVMAVQIYRLEQKDKAYEVKQKELEQMMAEEEERSGEIEKLAEYMKSDAYIEDVAKSKLGLTYENEIIFKEGED